MARRTSRSGARRRPRLGVFSLAALAILGGGLWMAPSVLVHTALRDRPLEAAFTGIAGRVSSRAARWTWLTGIEYHDVVLSDGQGRPAVIVPSVVIERGLVALAADPRNLGTVRLSGAEAVIAVRPGGSSLEDILAPWLAASGDSAGVKAEIELVGGTVELVDLPRGDAWRVSDLIAAGSLEADGTLAGWTVAGRVRHAGRPQDAAAPPVVVPAPQLEPRRLDRTTIPAAAAAALARDGGWSISAPAVDAGGGRTIAVATHRLPLGISSVAATRFGSSRLVDGLVDLRLDVVASATASELRGRAVFETFAVCAADSLVELFAVERCEVPLDVVIADGTLAVRQLRATSPVFEAEASGRLPLTSDDPWKWLEDAVAHDCSLAARIDLAAAAAALPGGLAVRRDVRVTGGTLDLTAAARADGGDRVIEVKLDARNLAAVRRSAASATDAADRPLRWSEPLTVWLRGRRGPDREAGLRIEEGRLASPSAEVSATGTPAALRVEWTADLGGLVGEVSEVLDLGGLRLAGQSRGRLDAERAAADARTLTLAASVADFELGLPGRPAWRDNAITLDGQIVGTFDGPLAGIDRARGMVSAAGDSIEVSLTGGVLVDTAAAADRRPAEGWIRPSTTGGEVAADCSITGDLGRWHARVAALVPELANVELGGSITASAAVAPDVVAGADAWRITKAGGEIERFVMRSAGRHVAEPRVVATAAGVVRPATGRIEISSAEVLSSSLSIRSGGASWQAATDADSGPLAALLGGFRGRIQWQADLARLEEWVLPTAMAATWPVTGRAWGTLDVSETQVGVNLAAEATGSQVVIAERTGGRGDPRPVWSEPQATIGLELTRPFGRAAPGLQPLADRLVIDRLAVESSTLAVAARGAVEEWSGRRRGELTGSLSYDWAQLSRLATPWTGGRIRLAGAVNRPFVVRGSLAGEAMATASATAAATAVPLPEAWLAATRGGDSDPAPATGIVVPVTPAASSRRFTARLEGLSLETSAAWTTADIEGLSVAAGDLPIRLVEGQLAVGPFDLAASGGRLRGNPWWRLDPFPGEVIVPPGRLVERVRLTGDVSNRLVGWISPLLGKATDTSALLTVDVAGARLPLGDVFTGEAATQVVFEEFEVRPSGPMQPLVNLLGRLQAVVDPRFALSDKPVLLRVRSEPIRVRLAEKRIWHEGLVMDSGQFTVTSRGSVGADGGIAMLVEVGFRGDLAGQTPVVATLLRTPIAIPLKGTLTRPQFDAGAIDVTLKRVLENTARAVVDEGLGRGLEAIFGRPPAPAQPVPLTLPR